MTSLEAIHGSVWQAPKRILLLTYDRPDHIITTYDHSVVGVPGDRGSQTRAGRVRPGDWVMIRLSQIGRFAAARPAMVTGRGSLQGLTSPYPALLWEAEKESGRIIYPFRIPVTFEGGPMTKPGCVNWQSLAELRLRGKDGFVLEVPQQWGIKFTTNVLDVPHEVSAFVDLVLRCADAER